jgi:hypothetical protein
VRNRAQCAKCSEIIESTYRHDFKSCKCRTIFIDGGNDYWRCGGDLDSFIRLNDDDSPFIDPEEEASKEIEERPEHVFAKNLESGHFYKSLDEKTYISVTGPVDTVRFGNTLLAEPASGGLSPIRDGVWKEITRGEWFGAKTKYDIEEIDLSG